METRALSSGTKIFYHIDRDVPKLIVNDEVKTKQILFNLVGNSLKFTKKGAVEIVVTNGESGLYVKVKDSGVGIPEEFQDKIFETYEQCMEHSETGSGLGLAIVKKLASLIGNGVKLVSSSPKGTVFSFHINRF